MLPSGVIVRLGAQTLRLEAWGRDTIRVQAALDGRFDPVREALVTHEPTPAQVEATEGAADVRSGGLRAHVTAEGHVSFYRGHEAHPLLTEPPTEPLMGSQNPVGRQIAPLGDGAFAVSATFASFEDERFYGLGQHTNGRLDQKGCVIELRQRNAEVDDPGTGLDARLRLLLEPAVSRPCRAGRQPHALGGRACRAA